jgi:hypothetical protein
MPGYLDRLPDMSPSRWPENLPERGRCSRERWITTPTLLVIAGVAVFSVSGLCLGGFVLGPALETDPGRAEYLAEVARRIRHYDAGRITVPTVLGLISGAACVVKGLYMAYTGGTDPAIPRPLTSTAPARREAE